MKRVLVVGAGGFTGGFIVTEGLRRGCEVWAGVRETTSRKYLDDPSIHFLTLDFDNPETLAGSMEKALPEGRNGTGLSTTLEPPNASHSPTSLKSTATICAISPMRCPLAGKSPTSCFI